MLAVLNDLYEAFDYIPNNLLIAKISAYGLSNDSLCYICFYLKQRKQSVKINNKQSEFNAIITGVSQSSIFGPILFNVFFQ